MRLRIGQSTISIDRGDITDWEVDAMRNGELLVLQPDASTCGLAEARAMAAAAAGFGVRVVPHVCAGPIALAAGLHLAATVPAIRMIEAI